MSLDLLDMLVLFLSHTERRGSLPIEDPTLLAGLYKHRVCLTQSDALDSLIKMLRR